jgi:hypothetical protein
MSIAACLRLTSLFSEGIKFSLSVFWSANSTSLCGQTAGSAARCPSDPYHIHRLATASTFRIFAKINSRNNS